MAKYLQQKWRSHEYSCDPDAPKYTTGISTQSSDLAGMRLSGRKTWRRHRSLIIGYLMLFGATAGIVILNDQNNHTSRPAPAAAQTSAPAP